jgi:hypothetical protein
MDSDIAQYGEPSPVATEWKHRFGEFVVPENSHIKFGDLKAEAPSYWHTSASGQVPREWVNK